MVFMAHSHAAERLNRSAGALFSANCFAGLVCPPLTMLRVPM